MRPPEKETCAWSQGCLRPSITTTSYKQSWPHEVAAKNIIPAIRGLLSHLLSSQGYSQHKIAGLLAVTQPMVSKYLRRKPEYYYRLLEEIGINRGHAEHTIKLLARLLLSIEDEASRIILLASTVNKLLLHSRICTELEKESPRACNKLFGAVKDPYVSEVEKAIELLSSLPGFEELLPHVGSNLVFSPFSDKDLDSIIGLEGRINRGPRGIVVGGKPVYGGSRHTARILAEVVSKDPSKRACIVLKYDRLVERSLEALRQKIVYIEREAGETSLEEPILRTLRGLREVPDAVIDKGGYGIEPVVYLFASSPMELVEKVEKMLRIIRAYTEFAAERDKEVESGKTGEED